jgi:spermidine/putrescine transport system substrate-binding protein
MVHLNLLQPLNPAQLPNLKNLDKQFANPPYDQENKFSVPYQWGTMGIMYRKDKITQLDPTWMLFFDPARQPGPFVLNDSMRDTIGAALIAQGKSMNTKTPEDLKHAGELILQAKKSPKCLGFDGGVGGKNKVAAGQAVMAIVYNGDAVRAMDEEKNVGFVLPKEGTEIWDDAMTIPAQAPNPEAAHKFINFILEAKAGAELSNFNRYATPNAASKEFIAEADRKNPAIYPTEEEIKKMQYLEDIGDATRMYDEVWRTVKSR